MGADATTVVIVDDDTDVRALVKARLRMSGLFDVVGQGADGAEAVALAGEHRPALMLLDVSMPDVDGLEALPRVLEASPTTRVVMFSGFEEQGLVDKTRELGAVAFIEKSASLETLIQRLVGIVREDAAGSGHDRATSRLRPGAGPGARSRGDQRVLDEHLERFREVFEEAAIGMATTTLTGRLIRANRALGALLRRPADGLVGVPYGKLTDEDDDVVAGALDEINNKPVDVVQFEHGLAGEPGGRRVSATLAPVRDSNGRALYLFLQVRTCRPSALRPSSSAAARNASGCSSRRSRTTPSSCSIRAGTSSWNSGAQRSKGYTANEIIGQHFRVFYPPEVQAGSTLSTSSRWRCGSATTRRRAGASARTGPGSGPPC